MPDSAKYIIGLGNYARGDDSIGLRIVETIVERGLDRGFAAVDIGGNALNALAYFRERTERILFVDCALMDLAPGVCRVFAPESATSQKTLGRISTHESDLLKIVDLARRAELFIPDIRIMAIQPESLDAGMTLSNTLADQLDDYIRTALTEIGNGHVLSDSGSPPHH